MTRKKQKKSKKAKANFPSLPENMAMTKHEINCASYRGKIVHCVIDLEDLIEWIITEYYVIDDDITRTGFRASILATERFNLKLKCTAVLYIVKNEFPEFYQKHPYIAEEMEKIISFRNDVAHNKFRDSSLQDGEYLYLIHPSTKSNQMKYDIVTLSEEIMQNFYGQYMSMRKIFVEILHLVRKLRK